MARKPAAASANALADLGSPKPHGPGTEEQENPNEPRLDLPQLATGVLSNGLGLNGG